MRILFITDNFPPEVNAPATRTYEHCMHWLENDDIEICVVSCTPNFPHGKVYKGYKNKLYQKENLNGIEVIRVWSYITSNSGFVKRILDYLSFAFSAFFIGLFREYDVIIATSPQFFTTWTAWSLSKVKRRPWIFELRDLWPESIKTVGAMKEGRAIDLLEKIELGLYRDSNRVIALTEAFKANLIKRGINANKINVVTNGSNMKMFFPREKDKELSKKLKLENKFVFGYIGTHGLAHSLDFVVESLNKIKDENVRFLFIGDGAMKEKVILLAKELNLINITFLDSVPKEEVPRYMSIIDVSLVPLKKEDNFKTVIPSKIFEASAMEKPTLLGVEGQAKEIIIKYNAGLCFEPENTKDFIKKIGEMRNMVQYKKLQKGCLKLAEEFDRKDLAHKMLNIIRDVVE